MERCYYCNGTAVSARRPEVIVHGIGCPVVCRNARETWQKGYDDGERFQSSSSSDPTYMMGFKKGHLDRLKEEAENHREAHVEVDDPRDASLDPATREYNRGYRWGYLDQQLQRFWGKVTPDFERGYRAGKQQIDRECDDAAQRYV